MASFQDLTTAQLKQAVQIREQIESLQAKLDTLFGGSGTAQKAKVGRPVARRIMSAAGKSKMAAVQGGRRTKAKAASRRSMSTEKTATAVKRNVSPQTRAKLAAAMKARWAVRKKAAAAE